MKKIIALFSVTLVLMGSSIPIPPNHETALAQTADELLCEVARREPHFGGMFVGPDRVLRIYLSEESPDIVASVKKAIAIVYGDRLALNRIQVLKGEYGFLQLKAWYESLSAGVLGIPGVVFTDLEETKNRLRVGVEKPEIKDLVKDRLVQLGIPLEAVIIEETKPIQLE